MTHSVAIAAVQMEVTPAPDRLARARRLIEQAAGSGAQLIVLPELFNIGYRYEDANFQKAEPIDGPTMRWLKQLAARLHVHLAGSLLLRDDGEIYNALLVVAPDGRLWRYDKRYPWGWERAYFRAGRGPVVAQTALGDIGLMLCWDCAHPALWRAYAGRIDLMLIASCPPDVSDPTFIFPSGERVTFDQLGPFFRRMQGGAARVFGEYLNRQAAWLGAPIVNTVGCGQVRTGVPNARLSMLAMTPFAPMMLKHVRRAAQAHLTCAMTPGCKVIDAQGRTLAERAQAAGEGFALAKVTLPDRRRQPIGPQPSRPVSWFTYFSSDVALPLIAQQTYRRGRHLFQEKA